MASYSTTLDPVTGITHIVVAGGVLAADLQAYIESADFASRTDKVLCDLTNSTFSALSSADVINLARNVQHLSRPGIQGAYLVNKSVDVGMLNIFKVYAEQLRYEATMEVFTDRAKALEWLLQPDPESAQESAR